MLNWTSVHMQHNRWKSTKSNGAHYAHVSSEIQAYVCRSITLHVHAWTCPCLTMHCWHAQLNLRPRAAFLMSIVSVSIFASRCHFLFVEIEHDGRLGRVSQSRSWDFMCFMWYNMCESIFASICHFLFITVDYDEISGHYILIAKCLCPISLRDARSCVSFYLVEIQSYQVIRFRLDWVTTCICS